MRWGSTQTRDNDDRRPMELAANAGGQQRGRQVVICHADCPCPALACCEVNPTDGADPEHVVS